MAILVSSLLVTIGAILSMIAVKELQISSTIKDSVSAFYASESGIECAKYWFLKDPKYFTMTAGFGTITCNGLNVDLQNSPVHSSPSAGTDVFQFSLDNSSVNGSPIRVNVTRTSTSSGESEVITSSGYNQDPSVLSMNLVQRFRRVSFLGVCSQRMDLMMILDSSSSIDDYTINSPTVIKAANAAINNLDFTNDRAKAGIIMFSDYFHTGDEVKVFLAQQLSIDKSQVINSINNNYYVCTATAAGCAGNENNTNLQEAILMGITELQSPRHRANVPKVMLIVTDGQPIGYTDVNGNSIYEPTPYITSFQTAQAAVDQAKSQGIKIIVVGINTGGLACPAYDPAYGYPSGNQVCSDWMRDNVASLPSLYYPVTFDNIVFTLGNITSCSGNIFDK
jgi:hypothetical protein